MHTFFKLGQRLSIHLCFDEGLDAMAKLRWSVTSRTLRCLRDEFAEVAHDLHMEDTKAMPEQSTMDSGLKILEEGHKIKKKMGSEALLPNGMGTYFF